MLPASLENLRLYLTILLRMFRVITVRHRVYFMLIYLSTSAEWVFGQLYLFSESCYCHVVMQVLKWSVYNQPVGVSNRSRETDDQSSKRCDARSYPVHIVPFTLFMFASRFDIACGTWLVNIIVFTSVILHFKASLKQSGRNIFVGLKKGFLSLCIYH